MSKLHLDLVDLDAVHLAVLEALGGRAAAAALMLRREQEALRTHMHTVDRLLG